MSNNRNLHKAKKAKNDEFYTQLTDIEKELRHYREHFKGKVVYCNCDDARESNFFKYFSMNFEFLGLKKLITTGYKKDGRGVLLVYEGDKNGNKMVDDEEIRVTELEGDGDFRSPECVKLLEEADVVVTNPPFSLFREYVAQLVEHRKKFLIIGQLNAVTYKEIFPLIKNNKVWLGWPDPRDRIFEMPGDAEISGSRQYVENGKKYAVVSVYWFTNLDHEKRHEKLILTEKYDPAKYPKFDNYDAINVDKVSDIPCDYDGVMGVPITFLDKYNPEQFEIVQFRKGEDGKDLVFTVEREREMCRTLECSYEKFEKKFSLRWQVSGNERATVNGELKYSRLFFRRRKPSGETSSGSCA